MDRGFMGTFINVYHVDADGNATEIRTKEDAVRVLSKEAHDDDHRMP